MIRFSPQVVKVGESVSLYVSKGSQNVEGRVPNLQGQTPTSADALLAGAGLLTGNVTVEASDTVEEGLIISQSELPGTILPPGTAVDYVVSGEPAQTQAADERYYIGSIDEACSLSNYIGPASQTSSVRVLIRLNQTNDEDSFRLHNPYESKTGCGRPDRTRGIPQNQGGVRRGQRYGGSGGCRQFNSNQVLSGGIFSGGIRGVYDR